jgi:hypothetical protein
MMRLFQYGSNMAHQRFIERIRQEYKRHAPPGTPIRVTSLGAARLGGWSLRLDLWSATRGCRVLNIAEQDGSEVWGSLYDIASELVTRSDGKRSVVDRLEGHLTTRDPENYAKICVIVDLAGEAKEAWTYVGLRDAVDRCVRAHPATQCDAGYADAVIEGAESLGVPVDYLAELRKKLEPS